MFPGSKQTDVGASAVECVEDLDGWIWYRGTVVDDAPSFRIGYIYKKGTIFDRGWFE